MSTCRGYLDGFWETGTEGVMWAIEEDGKDGYDALCIVNPGDYLVITDTVTGETVFDGVLVPDYQIGYQPYPMNPTLGQQVSCGMYCHWIQTGFDPDIWGAFFIGNFKVGLDPETGYRWGARSGRYRGEVSVPYRFPHQESPERVAYWEEMAKHGINY